MLYILSLYDKTVARQALGFHDLWLDKPTMRTFDFYPYTGQHIQAHYHQVGPDTWSNQDFDVRSGDHGFFVDFPLDTPPAKQANEFRLVLIGGSSAQGWGGRTNDDMFYRRLEQQVNRLLAERGRATRLRVINLAMGGAVSYQNFIALNLWGHRLDPDAILSFSGFNELLVYSGNRSNLYVFGHYFGGFALSQRFAESPAWQKFLARYYPGIFRYSALAQAIRSLDFVDHAERYYHDYISRFPESEHTRAAAARFYVHALESIMRDFPRIPLLLVSQPFNEVRPDYEDFVEMAVQMLKTGAYSDRLEHLDAYSYWKRNDFFPGSLVDPAHLSNKGHELASDFLAEPVIRLVSEMEDKRHR